MAVPASTTLKKEVKKIHFDVQGSYHDKPMSGLVFVSPGLGITTVTILVHGVYGVTSPDEPTEKSVRLAYRLATEGISHVILYNSSRDFVFDDSMDYIERREAFKDKTFAQECEDLRRVVQFVRDNAYVQLNIKPGELKLNLHGNSLGGTLIVASLREFPEVQKVSLCGSGCGTNGSSKPILSTMPSEATILAGIADYAGELFLLQGSNDTTVPRESGLKIVQHATHAQAEVIIVPGANHNFTKINGVESDEARDAWVNYLFAFIAK